MHRRLLVALTLCTLAAAPIASGAQSGPNSQQPNSVDRTFVQRAMYSNLQEVTAARRHQNSRNRNVRLFARTMIRDHSAAAATLAALGSQLGLPYPRGGNMIQVNSNGSTAPQGSNHPIYVPPMSDNAYMRAQIQAHEQSIALFQNEMTNGNNQSLRSYAGQTMPQLRHHLMMARQYAAGRSIAPEPAL